jgi:hypothetical protein
VNSEANFDVLDREEVVLTTHGTLREFIMLQK